MKKSAKPIIVKFLFFLLAITTMVLISVGLRFRNEELTRKIVDLVKRMNEERTKKVNLIAEYQAYSSEDRIVTIAENKLVMKRRTEPKINVSVNKNLIDKVNKELRDKYD